jgi:integrase
MGPASNGRERRLKPGELEKLVEAARSCRNRWVLPIILFAIETGMRRGEILALRWEHIRHDEQSLLIPQTKNGYARIIPLSPRALELLSGLPVVEDRVFPTTAIALRLACDRIKLRACVADLHFHDLRHEAISRFFERGLTIPEVALISGHRDARMLFRYTHAVREGILTKLRALRSNKGPN